MKLSSTLQTNTKLQLWHYAVGIVICGLSIFPIRAFAGGNVNEQGLNCSYLSVGPIGNSLTSDGNNLACVSGHWQYPFYLPRSDSSTACSSGLTGALRNSGGALQYCDGTAWECMSGGVTLPSITFTNQTGVNPYATITSNAVTLTGCFGALTAVCGSGCTDIIHNSVDCSCTTLNNIVPGDTIAIDQLSGNGATTTASVTVGAVTSATWSVTSICQKVVTSSVSETNPYGASVGPITYSMIGGGGGGGSWPAAGGGGGSSAIINGGTLVAYAAGGNGLGTSSATAGSTASGSFTLASGATLAAYAGGGGGSGSNTFGGGGGGSGYYGGGGGDYAAIGHGGTNTGGAAGDSNATAGSSLAGGNGAYGASSNPGGSGGSAGTGGNPGTYSSSSGGGGGGYGGSGGGGYSLSGTASYAGGSNGANGGGTGSYGSLGANNWPTANSLPGAAGAAGSYYSGGNGGLVIMLYTSPGGGCLL